MGTPRTRSAHGVGIAQVTEDHLDLLQDIVGEIAQRTQIRARGIARERPHRNTVLDQTLHQDDCR